MKIPDYYTVEDGWLELVHGTQFYFNSPTSDMIHVEEIAHALSLLCRYNGHTRRYYSVAEHCILMADWVAKQTWATPLDVLTALHHDDAEYIIGDLARPVKAKMPQFKELELILDRAIALRFGTLYPFPPWLKEIDARIIQDERNNVINPSDNDWGTDSLVPLDVQFFEVAGRFPMLMRRAFLTRHHRWSEETSIWQEAEAGGL